MYNQNTNNNIEVAFGCIKKLLRNKVKSTSFVELVKKVLALSLKW